MKAKNKGLKATRSGECVLSDGSKCHRFFVNSNTPTRKIDII